MRNDFVIGAVTVLVIVLFISCAAIGCFIGQALYDRWKQRRRVVTPYYDEDEEPDEAAWSNARPPGHEMCRCAMHWCDLEIGLAKEEATRVQRLQPVNSAAWTGRE